MRHGVTPAPVQWRDTYETLHLWTQIVGKIRLAQAPRLNHWWQVPLYVTSRGLTTSAMPHGLRTFAIDFDFLAHELRIQASDGDAYTLPLTPQPVAEFYHGVLSALDALSLPVRIWTMPQEIEGAIPFDQDETHNVYDPMQAQRFWRVPIACCSGSAPVSSARPARCTSSGAASTWR